MTEIIRRNCDIADRPSKRSTCVRLQRRQGGVFCNGDIERSRADLFLICVGFKPWILAERTPRPDAERPFEEVDARVYDHGSFRALVPVAVRQTNVRAALLEHHGVIPAVAVSVPAELAPPKPRSVGSVRAHHPRKEPLMFPRLFDILDSDDGGHAEIVGGESVAFPGEDECRFGYVTRAGRVSRSNA